MSFDDEIRDALERATAGLTAQLERALAVFAHDLTRAAIGERDRAAREAADASAADVRRQADEQMAQLREAAQAQASEIKHAAEAQVGDLRQRLQAQLDDLRRVAHADGDAARRSAQEAIDEARRAAAAQVEDVQRRAGVQLDETRREYDLQIGAVRHGAQVDLERAQAEVARAELTADAVRAEADERLAASLAAARAEAEETLAVRLAAARAEADEAVTAKLATAQAEAEKRIVNAIRALDDARSLGETLDALAEGAGQHVARAAVLIVRGDRLRARRLAGFGGDNAEGAINLDFDEAGLAGAVVSTGVSVSRPIVEPGDEARTRQPALPPFAQDAGPRHAVALPIVVGERVVGVLYADAPEAGASGASRWPATLEVLARHASRALEAMTVHQVTGLSRPRPVPRAPGATSGQAGGVDEEAARRYARLLVSEIRMYHEPVVDAGRRSRDLRTRLGGEIDRARRLYEERVPPAIRERSDFFEQELVRTLADGDRSLLG